MKSKKSNKSVKAKQAKKAKKAAKKENDNIASATTDDNLVTIASALGEFSFNLTDSLCPNYESILCFFDYVAKKYNLKAAVIRCRYISWSTSYAYFVMYKPNGHHFSITAYDSEIGNVASWIEKMDCPTTKESITRYFENNPVEYIIRGAYQNAQETMPIDEAIRAAKK